MSGDARAIVAPADALLHRMMPREAFNRNTISLRVGDVIALGRCGAYSVTEGVAVFLSRDMPRVALCRGGDFTLVRDRFATDVLNTCRTPEDEA